MDRFQVWIHPMENACRVRVEGIQNAKWLLSRLSESFVFKSSEAIKDEWSYSYSIFNVLYTSQLSLSKFKKLLEFIPEVKLLLAPAKRGKVHVDLGFERLQAIGPFPRGGGAKNQQLHEDLVVFALLMNPIPPNAAAMKKVPFDPHSRGGNA
jgi:hypothetical protein